MKIVNDQIKSNSFVIKYEAEKFKKYEVLISKKDEEFANLVGNIPKAENIRRKHNYIPFILDLMRLTAQKGNLTKFFEEAKERREARAKQKETLNPKQAKIVYTAQSV